MKQQVLKHEFVEFIPDEIEQGIIYISITVCDGNSSLLLRLRK